MSSIGLELSWIQRLVTATRSSGMGRNIARTAGFNIGSTAAAGLGGIILARVLGPTVRGEYAAITAWFGVSLMVGGMGQRQRSASMLRGIPNVLANMSQHPEQ